MKKRRQSATIRDIKKYTTGRHKGRNAGRSNCGELGELWTREQLKNRTIGRSEGGAKHSANVLKFYSLILARAGTPSTAQAKRNKNVNRNKKRRISKMDYLKQLLFFLILLLINFISLIFWKIIETKLNIKATEKKIDSIYLKIIHLIKDNTVQKNEQEEITK